MTQKRIIDSLNMNQTLYCLYVRFNIECQVFMSAGHLMLERLLIVASSACVKLPSHGTSLSLNFTTANKSMRNTTTS